MAKAGKHGRKKRWYGIGAMAIACIFFLALDFATTRSISWSVWPIGALLFFGIAYHFLNRFGRE